MPGVCFAQWDFRDALIVVSCSSWWQWGGVGTLQIKGSVYKIMVRFEKGCSNFIIDTTGAIRVDVFWGCQDVVNTRSSSA